MDVSSRASRARSSGRILQQGERVRQKGTVAHAPELTTETAVTMFAIASGVGGAMSQLLAANKLSTTGEDTIPVSNLVVPVGLATAGAILGSALLPGEFDIPSPRSVGRRALRKRAPVRARERARV